MNKMESSKALSHNDDSGFFFAQEMLDGDVTAAINFDRLQKHPQYGYIIFEYLLCDEKQFSRGIQPYTSHPRKYWYKNRRKFLGLWNAAKSLNAILYLVNYSKKGTAYENEILLIQVKDMDETGIIKEDVHKMTRENFKEWFRKINSQCL